MLLSLTFVLVVSIVVVVPLTVRLPETITSLAKVVCPVATVTSVVADGCK
jgi:hypothetical protein